MFHGHLDYFQNLPLEGRPNTKPGDRDTPNAHNCRFVGEDEFGIEEDENAQID